MIFRNRLAAFFWGFAAVLLLFVAAMTYIFVRDGAPVGYSTSFVVAVMAMFWLGGFGFAPYVARKPCLRAAVRPDGSVAIVWRYPFKTVTRESRAGELKPAVVIESRDDEGDPYFHSRLPLTDGTHIDLAEGHDRSRCEATCDRFNVAALRRDS